MAQQPNPENPGQVTTNKNSAKKAPTTMRASKTLTKYKPPTLMSEKQKTIHP